MFLLILLSAFASSAQEESPVENYHEYESVDVSFALNSSVEMQGGPVSELKVDLSFFPKQESGQSIISSEDVSTPPAEITTDESSKRFVWRNIDTNRVDFGARAKMKISRQMPRVLKKIEFPVHNLDSELSQYTKATQFIDLNAAIESQALALAGSENDVYRVIFKLADWTKQNIEYDLSTLTADVVQKSSWVLEQKQGVCDELTNLFISLVRSLGVPARFVSGMVYSNIGYDFGPHGWAEVFFPGVGWVPFDITFGQFGWIDASHVKLKDHEDSGSPATEYQWQPADVEMDVGEIVMHTQLLSTGPRAEPMVEITAEPKRKAVRQGSVVPLFVTVENKKPFYVSPILVMTKAPGVRGSNTREVLLGPGETKTVAWALEIPEEVKEGYIYTSTIEVVSPFGEPARAQVRYGEDFEFFNEIIALKMVDEVNEQSAKQQLDGVSFTCQTANQLYYVDEVVSISCRLTNQRVSSLDGRVCSAAQCKQLSLAPGGTESISFEIKAVQSGRTSAVVEVDEGVVYAFFDLNVVKIPEVTIQNVQPQKVNYKDNVEVSFDVVSDEVIQDVVMQFDFKELELGSIEGEKNIRVTTAGRFIVEGLKFNLFYKDAKGKSYESKEIVQIEVVNILWYAKALYWVKNLFG